MANKKKKVTTTVTTTVTEEIVSTNEKTHIICILDRSGSMASIISDSIGGFNTFLKQQKELPDEATITVALFDDEYDLLYNNINIKSAEELTNKVWIPRGMTALHDAIGKTINNEKARFVKMGADKPAKVLVCIVTDGLENASKEYTRDGIKNLIKQCEEENWNFLYLAANQNAFDVGTSFGVSANNTHTYMATSDGVQHMSMTLSNASASYRGMSSYSSDFKTRSKSLITKEDEDEIKDSGTLIVNGTTITAPNGTTQVNNTGNAAGNVTAK